MQPEPPPLVPSVPPPHPRSHPGTLGFPQEPKDGSCLLGQRPHLEFIPFIKLVAASQAPAPLIPQSPVHVVNKDSNLFIKNGPPSQQASGLLPALGREGGGEAERGGPRVRATPPGASLGQSPTCSGHSLPNSPSDSEDAWGTVWGEDIRQLLPAPLLLRDRALWLPNQCGQLDLAPSPCANHSPSRGIYCCENKQNPLPQSPPIPPLLPRWIPSVCPWSSSDPPIQGYSLLCPGQAGSSGRQEPGSGGQSQPMVTRPREATRPSDPGPLLMS